MPPSRGSTAMRRITVGRAASCLVLLLCIGLYAVSGQEKDRPKDSGSAQPKTESGSRNSRILYVVKYGSAKDLAGILGKHLKGDAEVQLLPDASSNCLL